MLKVLIVFYFCLLMTCGNSVSQNAVNLGQVKNSNQNSSEIFNQNDNDTFLVEMNRSECFGTCPAYNLKVRSDGKVVFEGKKFTKIVGKTETVLDGDKLKDIITEINKSDFFSFENDYQYKTNCPEFMSDAPNVVLSINLGDKKKTITHNYGCEEKGKIFPQELYNLENKIDEIVETKRWIGERK